MYNFFTVILIGYSFIGKASLIIRICKDIFESSDIARVGIVKKTKFIKKMVKKFNFKYGSPASQKRFRRLPKNCSK